MTKTIHIIEVSTGEYDSYGEVIIGAVETKAEAEAIVAAYTTALEQGKNLPKGSVDTLAMHDGHNSHVYTYEVTVGEVPVPPVIGYLAYAPDQKPSEADRLDEIKAAFFNPITGEEMFGSLLATLTPPAETMILAANEPEAVFPFESKAYTIVLGCSIQEHTVQAYASLSLPALTQKIGVTI